jgi:hypothetical protein
MQTTFKKLDALIIALCLIAAALLFFLPQLSARDQTARLIISYRDGTEQTYSLASDQVLTLHSGAHTLTVVMEDGTVRVSESDCPDGLCRAGRIWRDGETLVCLPAGIVLTITNGAGGEIDAVVG